MWRRLEPVKEMRYARNRLHDDFQARSTRGLEQKHRHQDHADDDRYADREDHDQSRERLIFFHLVLCFEAS